MTRRHNTNLIRTHATYTVDEIAACMAVHSRSAPANPDEEKMLLKLIREIHGEHG